MTDWSWPGSTIVRVVDGDTFDATVTRDLGFGGRAVFPIRLRLNRINAPKGSTADGKAATAYLVTLLPLAVSTQLTTTGPYKYGGPDWATGEWMAEVDTPAGNVSDLMVTAGHAVYWDGSGPRPNDNLRRP